MIGPVAASAERRRPERRRRLEADLHRVAIELVDPRDVPIRTDGDGGGPRVHHVLPGEHHVVGGEGLAVVPHDVLLQLPGHRHPVLRDLAVLETRRLGREDRNDVAVGIVRGERLVEDAAGVLVLGAVGEVRVQQGGRLPPERLDEPAAATLGGIGRPLGLGLRDAGRRQHLGGQRGRQAEPDHHPNEATAAQGSRLHLIDQRPQLTLFH